MWGCFLKVWVCLFAKNCLPHACGGVSLFSLLERLVYLSSPRMWGCFSFSAMARRFSAVFPTHVGVFPWKRQDTRDGSRSSPRMWGCFNMRLFHAESAFVFPTHVGVFPNYKGVYYGRVRLPHACGGVSVFRVMTSGRCESSPRMWGCFSSLKSAFLSVFVFPTHVGVFLV